MMTSSDDAERVADRQQALARAVLRDPAVASVTSFIGVDGVNQTLNSGRLQINLVPKAKRGLSWNLIRDTIYMLGSLNDIFDLF